jgi:hypothetical protein
MAGSARKVIRALRKQSEDTAKSECNGLLSDFDKWLKTTCFQKPTPEAYDLAKDAWKEARKTALPLDDSNNPFCDNCREEYCLVSSDNTCAMVRKYLKKEINIVSLAKDHYWDSLEKDADLIIKHIIGMVNT